VFPFFALQELLPAPSPARECALLDAMFELLVQAPESCASLENSRLEFGIEPLQLTSLA